MSDYYDKEKFSSGRQPPKKKKQDDSAWFSWPVIVVFFAIGLWPVALALLFFNIFSDERKKKRSARERRLSTEERMERTVEDAVERAMEKAAEKLESKRGAQRKSAAAETLAQHQGGGGRSRSAPAQGASGQGQARPAGTKEKKKQKKSAGVMLRLFGALLAVTSVFVGVQAAVGLWEGYSFYLEELLQAVVMLGAGGVMFFRGQYVARMTRRSQRYILAIGNADAMPIAEIAKRVGRSAEKATRELQKLIEKGYLGEDAYIDRERGYFLRFGATLEEPEAEPEKEEEAVPPPPKEVEEGYSGILRSLRRANDRIADEDLSRKIDRLEQISGLIFKEVEEHPEKRDRIRTFFDYYLPTTQKLLDTYAEFEETGVEGEHLREAKVRIEQTMDAIVEGFEHQLDQLYSSDALDVFSDIKVMESMLSRDTASAAKDFGYAEPPRTRPKSDGQSDGQEGMQQLEL